MATRTLASARNYYLAQRRLSALALRAARRARTVRKAAEETARYQMAAAALAASFVASQASEQGLDPAPVAPISPPAWAGLTSAGGVLLDYLSAASTPDQRALRAVQQVVDAGRSAHGVATAATPSLAGHIRYLNPPSCARCAILAGRFYRYSEGFERHTNCDCVMVAVGEDVDPNLIGDPMQAWRDGQILNSRIDKETGERIFSPGFTQAQQKALDKGANMAKLVNLGRGSGIKVPGRGLKGGRLTPDAIFQINTDRNAALSQLRQWGYIR